MRLLRFISLIAAAFTTILLGITGVFLIVILEAVVVAAPFAIIAWVIYKLFFN